MAKIPVTVYTTPNCVQCNMTKRQFDKLGVEYSVVDLSENPLKAEEFKQKGYLAAPIVTTDTKTWAGFKPAKINSLADHIKSLARGETK